DDAAVLAKAAHIGRAVEYEADGAGVTLVAGLDSAERRRQRRERFGKVPLDRLIEAQRVAAVAALGHHIGGVGQVEHITREGRLRGDAYADGRGLALDLVLAPPLQLAFGLARAPGQF